MSENVSLEPRVGSRGFWKAWTWINWFIFAAIVLLRGFTTPSGWEMVMLMLYAPAILPITALLGQAPRMILRRRGFETVPAPIGSLLIAQWVAMFFAIHTLYGAGDGPSWPSPLSITLRLSEDAASWVTALAFFIYLGLALATIVVAALTKHPERYTLNSTRHLVIAGLASFAGFIALALFCNAVLA